MKDALVKFTPGTAFSYSNPGVAMLNYAVTSSLQGSGYSDIRSYLKDRIYDPLGISPEDYSIGYGKTYHVNGLSLVAGLGGCNFTADGLARIGSLMLHNVKWRGNQLLDSSIVREAVAYEGTALPASRSVFTPEWSNRSDLNPVPASTLGWYNNFDGVWFFPQGCLLRCGSSGTGTVGLSQVWI